MTRRTGLLMLLVHNIKIGFCKIFYWGADFSHCDTGSQYDILKLKNYKWYVEKYPLQMKDAKTFLMVVSEKSLWIQSF